MEKGGTAAPETQAIAWQELRESRELEGVREGPVGVAGRGLSWPPPVGSTQALLEPAQTLGRDRLLPLTFLACPQP